MRILFFFLIGLISFFYLGEIFNRVLKQPLHAWPGFILIIIGLLTILFGGNLMTQPLDILLGWFLVGSGIGLSCHHLFYKGYFIFETKERALIRQHIGFFERSLEILPGALTWIALTSPIWLSFTFPFALAYLIMAADVYWLFNSIKIASLVLTGYRRMKLAIAQDWLEKLKQDFSGEWNQYHHLILLPTYKEGLEILKPAFDAIVNSDYPKEKIFLAVGFEARVNPKQLHAQTIKYLESLKNQLGGVFISFHPADLPGEIAGPATNRNWMARNAQKEFEKLKINPEMVLNTTLDADFVIHPRFLAGALHKYLSLPKNIRPKRSLTGVFLYHNNYWQAPTPMRLIAAGTAFWQLAEMVGSDKYIHFSSFSTNFKSLLDVGLWIPNKVNDDSGLYWKAYFHFKGDYKIIPHYLPISADTVTDVTLLKTFQNQYLQLKRWAYGVEHIPFIFKQYFKIKDMDFWDKTDKLTFILWSYMRWGSLALFITFAGLFIPVINPNYAQSVVAVNQPLISSWILTAAFIGLFTTIYVHEKTVPPRPKKWSMLTRVWSYVQWLLIPIILVSITTIPAIDAQTSLMLGRYLEFRTTNKVRLTS